MRINPIISYITKMKRNGVFYLLILLVFSILELACLPIQTDIKGEKCSVNVYVDNIPDTTFAKVEWLCYDNDLFEIKEIDSIPIINGFFSFECTLKRLTSASIRINENYMRIYLEPGDITVKLDGSVPYYIKQFGTSVDDELDAVNRYLHENNKRSFNNRFNQFAGYVFHTESYSIVEHQKTVKQRQKLLLKFCRSHINYKIIPDLLHQILLLDDEYDGFLYAHQIERIYNSIPSENKNSEFYKLLAWELKQVLLSIKANKEKGFEAPDIQCTAINGEPQRLFSLIGDGFVLLRFGGGLDVPTGEPQRLADYYTIPKLRIVSIMMGCNSDEIDSFSRFVQGKWPVFVTKYDYSYYGVRLLRPSCIYLADRPLYVLISPNGTVIARWEGRGIPSRMELEKIISNYVAGNHGGHGVGSSDHSKYDQ